MGGAADEATRALLEFFFPSLFASCLVRKALTVTMQVRGGGAGSVRADH